MYQRARFVRQLLWTARCMMVYALECRVQIVLRFELAWRVIGVCAGACREEGCVSKVLRKRDMRRVALLRADCCRTRWSNDLFKLLPILFSLVQTRTKTGPFGSARFASFGACVRQTCIIKRSICTSS